ETAQARQLALRLNGLDQYDFRELPKNVEGESWNFGDGLAWDEDVRRWRGLRCAVVEFTKKSGGGIEQKLGVDPRPGETFYFPIIQCNRYETIDRVVNEFLTPAENVVKVVDGELLDEPVMRLPQRVPGSPAIVETLESHLITGSQREDNDGEAGEYVDKCENHLLLADGYSALAEMIAVGESAVPFGYQPLPDVNPRNFRRRGGLGSARRGGVKL
ncbi:MAG: hypothetical protein ACPG32_16025, partial [Akkermansiaceae bacterium]